MMRRRRRRQSGVTPSPTTAIEYVLHCWNPQCGAVWSAIGGDDDAFRCPTCGGSSVVVVDTHLRYEGGPGHDSS